MKKFDLVIFDLDGTIFDTKASIISSIDLARKNYGLRELTDEDKKVFLGPPLDYSIRKVFNTDDDLTNKLIAEFRRVYVETEMYKTYMYDGILNTLKYLNDNGYKVALSTYKSQHSTDKLFEYFEITKYFKTINGSLGHESSKKEILIRSMEDTNVLDPNKIVMVGDTEHDLKAAIAVGCYFLGMTYGFGYRDLTDEEKNYSKIISYLDDANNIVKEIEK